MHDLETGCAYIYFEAGNNVGLSQPYSEAIFITCMTSKLDVPTYILRLGIMLDCLNLMAAIFITCMASKLDVPTYFI